MQPKNDLHQLIISLSQAEKRYFKIFASRHNKETVNNYVRLFDAINSQKLYNEDKLRKLFENETFIKHLPSEKNYLYKLILRAMRAFHVEKTIDKQLKDFLDDSAFLYKKRLYSSANKLLAKAKKLAIKHEKFLTLLEILDRERQNIVKERTGIQKKINENIYQRKNVLVQLSNFHEYQIVNDVLFVEVRKKFSLNPTTIDESFDHYLEEESMEGEEKAISFRAKLKFHSIKAFVYQLQGNLEANYKVFERIVELWFSQPEFQKSDPVNFKIALSNFLNAIHSTAKYSRFEEILDKIKNIKSQSKDEEAETFQNIYYYQLLYYMNSGRFGMGIALIPRIEEAMKKYKNKFNRSRILAFSYNISLLFLITEKYKEGLKWIRKILDDEKSDHRNDLQFRARILQILFQIEIGNLELIGPLYRSAIRYFRKNNGLGTGEDLILKGFRKYPDLKNKQAKNKLYNSLLASLEANPSTICKNELRLYLQSKITNKAMFKVLEEQVDNIHGK